MRLPKIFPLLLVLMAALNHRHNKVAASNDGEFMLKDDRPGSTGVATNVRNVFPVDKHDAICLVVSSCFFLIPGAYAFSTDLPLYGIVSTVTTLVSANYWRHAVEGMRRNADLITAKVSFAIYCISGFYYMRDWRLFAVGIPGVCGIGFFYYMANRYWGLDSPYWVYFHMLFHLFVALEQALVIYAILNSGKLKLK